MRTVRQQLRQPLKTLAGILMTALAVAVLGISVSQTLAAQETAKKLNETYLTVGFPSNSKVASRDAWMERMITQHPDIITADLRHSLASAYIPGLIYDNHTEHANQNDVFGKLTGNELPSTDILELQPQNLSCSHAMLEVTLTQVGVPYMASQILKDEFGNYMVNPDGTLATVPVEGGGCCTKLTATVTRVIGLQEGYFDPTGFTLDITLYQPTPETVEALELECGQQRYLVYGQDYQDLDWLVRDDLAERMSWRQEEALPNWDLSTLQYNPQTGKPYKCRIGDLYTDISGYSGFLTASLTLIDKTEIAMYSAPAELKTPTIVKLDGTVEEFLQSPEGALWQKTLDDLNVNTHAFPVIVTEDVKYIAAFATGNAVLEQGRGFQPGETGVCVISSTLAEKNGIQLGDTLDMQFYDMVENAPGQKYIRNGEGIVNPTAYPYYSDATAFAGDMTGYQVVGIYKQLSPWGNVTDDLYGINPNTIFVPTGSVSAKTDSSLYGQFRTIVIENDRFSELLDMAMADNMAGAFEFYDNGYNAVASTLVNFEAAAQRILPLGILVYAVIVALFLFLFPGREKKVLTRMDSLGAPHRKRVGYILGSTLTVLIPGSVLGTLAAVYLWQYAATEIKKWMQVEVAIQFDATALWKVAGIQLVLIALLSLVIGLVLSLRVNYMKKR